MTELTIDQALQQGVEAHKAGQIQEADRLYTSIIQTQPKHPDANHNMGVLAVGVGKVQEALPFFKIALEANPATAQFWLSYIDTLIKLDQLADAKAVLDQAKSKGAKGDSFDMLEQRLNEATVQKPPQNQLQTLIDLYSQGQLQQALKQAEALVQQFPMSVVLYNIQGAILQELGKLDLSINAYNKALAIEPNYADAHYNMGMAFQRQGKLKEAIKAYNKALAIKPDNAEAYNNMGGTLEEQGKLEEAIEAYNKALTIKPDCVEAHRHRSTVTKYNPNDPQINEVDELLQRQNLNKSERCHLHYTYAKMKEDLGDLSVAFDNYVAGGELRQKLLTYDFTQDKKLFSKIKNKAPQFRDVTLNLSGEPIKHTPIFILGMPRSGTTLIEQIVSSHTQVTGAGELGYLSRFGIKLVAGLTAPTVDAVSVFRKRYKTSLQKRLLGRRS